MVGEIGLATGGPQTADVVTMEAGTEPLEVDGAFLQRLRRRFPGVAAKLFLNLSRIHSKRPSQTTQALIQREAPVVRTVAK